MFLSRNHEIYTYLQLHTWLENLSRQEQAHRRVPFEQVQRATLERLSAEFLLSP